MDTIIILTGVTTTVAINSLIAFFLGWLLTEVFTLPLRFKPFNCRPCLTFWLTVLLDSVLAWIAAPYFIRYGMTPGLLIPIYGITGVGVLAAFINFLYIKLKFRVYD